MKTSANPDRIRAFAVLLQAALGIMLQENDIISADIDRWPNEAMLHLGSDYANLEFFTALDPDFSTTTRAPGNRDGLYFTITAHVGKVKIIVIIDEQQLREHFPDQADDLVAQWHVEYDEEKPRDEDK